MTTNIDYAKEYYDRQIRGFQQTIIEQESKIKHLMELIDVPFNLLWQRLGMTWFARHPGTDKIYEASDEEYEAIRWRDFTSRDELDQCARSIHLGTLKQ